MTPKDVSKIKVNFYIDKVLLDYLDQFAKLNGISRSGAISVIVSQHMQAHNGLDTINQLMKVYGEAQAAEKEKSTEALAGAFETFQQKLI